MPDKEKVIQSLDDSLKNQRCGFIDGVGDVYAVSEEIIKNVIVLLKEQEERIEQLDHALAVTQDNLYYYLYGND